MGCIVIANMAYNKVMLHEYLDKHGLTGKDFAKLCKLKQYEISRILTGSRKASVRIATAIELATEGEITRKHLRPDIYGIRESEAA